MKNLKRVLVATLLLITLNVASQDFKIENQVVIKNGIIYATTEGDIVDREYKSVNINLLKDKVILKFLNEDGVELFELNPSIVSIKKENGFETMKLLFSESGNNHDMELELSQKTGNYMFSFEKNSENTFDEVLFLKKK
jgi:hypothetical protein